MFFIIVYIKFSTWFWVLGLVILRQLFKWIKEILIEKMLIFEFEFLFQFMHFLHKLNNWSRRTLFYLIYFTKHFAMNLILRAYVWQMLFKTTKVNIRHSQLKTKKIKVLYCLQFGAVTLDTSIYQHYFHTHCCEIEK